jgi:hypothetical protein
MAEQEANAVEGPKTAADVLKMEISDELKFGVLVGLLSVEQISNKDLLSSLMKLVSLCISE